VSSSSARADSLGLGGGSNVGGTRGSYYAPSSSPHRSPPKTSADGKQLSKWQQIINRDTSLRGAVYLNVLLLTLK
jgi:hypothetical protein